MGGPLLMSCDPPKELCEKKNFNTENQFRVHKVSPWRWWQKEAEAHRPDKMCVPSAVAGICCTRATIGD